MIPRRPPLQARLWVAELGGYIALAADGASLPKGAQGRQRLLSSRGARRDVRKQKESIHRSNMAAPCALASDSKL